MCSEYNGWENYETWAVNLWLSNDQALYLTTRELVTMFTEYQFEKEQALREFVEELCGPPLQNASIVSDLLGHSLAQVNWKSIVEALEEE